VPGGPGRTSAVAQLGRTGPDRCWAPAEPGRAGRCAP
jgi:hypothetical protein